MIKSYNARFSYGIMNRISSVAIAIMLTMTTMGTGSLENPDFETLDQRNLEAKNRSIALEN